ncbi:TRAF3-interacting protein 1 [Hyalella azteca]|uniref:TRAF3-interacting protein 1 n=1 Tax=Hyalella azteca TaxID=294128 RepID=A0A979FXQ0_HYAAZ|nr:TRAF3-interacting protein 1 [Hyalella azteca]
MADAVDPAVIKLTQDQLGKYVTNPSLTAKLLNKPPFKFLHDVINSVITNTGFLQGLYTDAELNKDNIKDKDAKISFLEKCIDATIFATGENLTVRPSKIVSGHEADKTNEFLQALAQAIDNKADSDEAVKRVLAGEKPSKGKTKEKPSRSTEKSKDDDVAGSVKKTKALDDEPGIIVEDTRTDNIADGASDADASSVDTEVFAAGEQSLHDNNHEESIASSMKNSNKIPRADSRRPSVKNPLIKTTTNNRNLGSQNNKIASLKSKEATITSGQTIGKERPSGRGPALGKGGPKEPLSKPSSRSSPADGSLTRGRVVRTSSLARPADTQSRAKDDKASKGRVKPGDTSKDDKRRPARDKKPAADRGARRRDSLVNPGKADKPGRSDKPSRSGKENAPPPAAAAAAPAEADAADDGDKAPEEAVEEAMPEEAMPEVLPDELPDDSNTSGGDEAAADVDNNAGLLDDDVDLDDIQPPPDLLDGDEAPGGGEDLGIGSGGPASPVGGEAPVDPAILKAMAPRDQLEVLGDLGDHPDSGVGSIDSPKSPSSPPAVESPPTPPRVVPAPRRGPMRATHPDDDEASVPMEAVASAPLPGSSRPPSSQGYVRCGP